MDKNIEITMLYDVYGRLLTKRQQEIFEEYYLYNLSLREIAENKKISYQAVRDSIKTSEISLKDFEEKTHTLSITKRVKEAYDLCGSSEDLNKIRQQLKILLRNEDDI